MAGAALEEISVESLDAGMPRLDAGTLRLRVAGAGLGESP